MKTKPNNKKLKPIRSARAIEKLVNENMALAHYFATKHANAHHDQAALLSEAMRGLYHAAETWREETGVPFGSYASLRIKWLHIRLIKPPRSIRRGTEVAFSSIDADHIDGLDWHEVLADPEAKQEPDADRWEQVFKELPNLPDGDRLVLRLRFGLDGGHDRTLEEVAAKRKLTRERVRQIEKRALSHLACLVQGLPFRWDCKTQSCAALKGRAPASGGATKTRSPSSVRMAARRKKLGNSC